MVMTEGALLFLGALATLATLGLFANFDDRWTGVVVTFLAAILWGLFGMSAFDVIVRETTFADSSEPIMPLVYLGFGLAFIIAIYGFYDLLSAAGSEVNEADIGLSP